MKRFAIIGLPRSGTNLLVDLLEAHPSTRCHGEIFARHGIRTLRSRSRVEALTGETDLDAFRDRAPLRFLNAVWQARRGEAAIGFKMFANDFPEVQEALLRDPEVGIILLERGNRLAMHSSLEIAKLTDVWHSREAPPGAAPVRVAFDAAAFERYRAGIDALLADLRARIAAARGSAMEGVLELAYDDLTAPGISARLCGFLGLAGHPLAPGLRKQNPARVAERFEEPAAVVAHLARIGRPDWALGG